MNEIKNIYEDLKISNHLNYYKQYDEEGYNSFYEQKRNI